MNEIKSTKNTYGFINIGSMLKNGIQFKVKRNDNLTEINKQV